jgi:hypothetical protein
MLIKIGNRFEFELGYGWAYVRAGSWDKYWGQH